MVNTGTAYFTKYGSMHKTQEEAEKAEAIERESAFADTVLKLSGSNRSDRFSCAIREAAYYIYNNPAAFLQALREFGFFENEVTIEEL